MDVKIEKYLTPIGDFTMLNAKALGDDFGITTPEALFLSGLDFPENERVTGRSGQKVELDSIGLALYEFINGVLMFGSAAKRLDPNIYQKVAMAKSIFRKMYPEKFNITF